MVPESIKVSQLNRKLAAAWRGKYSVNPSERCWSPGSQRGPGPGAWAQLCARGLVRGPGAFGDAAGASVLHLPWLLASRPHLTCSQTCPDLSCLFALSLPFFLLRAPLATLLAWKFLSPAFQDPRQFLFMCFLICLARTKIIQIEVSSLCPYSTSNEFLF